MSYILDALRKADAERQRGHVPDLHTPRPGTAATPAAQTVQGQPVWLLAGGALLLLGALALAAWLMRPASAPGATAPAPGPTAAAPMPAPAVPPAHGALPPHQTQAQPPTTGYTPAPAPPLAQVPPPLRRPPPVAAAPVAAPAAEPAIAAAPPMAATPTAAAPAAAATDAVLPWAKVPPATRSALPALAFGGSMYSPDPKSRLVFLGGQPVHEGDSVAGGAVVVERIGEHAALLRFQGQRFWWPYRQ